MNIRDDKVTQASPFWPTPHFGLQSADRLARLAV